MNAISKVRVEMTVVLGATEMPVRQLLKMGRGAVIDLDAGHDDEVRIYANGELVALGEIMIVGDRIGVSITRMVSEESL
ncbi:MAG: hypothetical protein KatS3mg119_1327 [Rhodothalassiaceae bacterium]|nr:MAG: hypothetical protein KatS3mg119_1327 [Rhodothalassiaceae bacterium]